jgi:hypothetical protein
MARAAIVVAVLVPLAACALPIQQAATSTPPNANSTPYPQFSPVVSSGQVIIKTITQFCNAVHAGQLDQAYTFLSSRYKHTITKPSQILYIVPRETFLDCSEWGQGDFLKFNGSEATDQLLYTVKLEMLGSQAQSGGSMTFVQEGADWKIDDIIIAG